MNKNIAGTHNTPGRNGHRYTYDGTWWRFDSEVHWKATIFRDSFKVGSCGGAIPRPDDQAEDEMVRHSIEAFVETSERAAEQANSRV